MNNLIKSKNVTELISYIQEGNVPVPENLNIAIETGDINIIRVLIENNVIPSDENLKTAITKLKDVNITKYLLDNGAVIRMSTLKYAMHYTKNIEMVQLVLERGAKLDDQSFNDAISIGKIEIVELLLKYGGKPNNSSINIAIYKGYLSILRLITKNRGDFNLTPEYVENIINLAINTGDIGYIKVLLDNLKIVPNTNNLDTSINSFFGKDDIVELLLNAGSNPNNNILKKLISKKRLSIIKLVILKKKQYFKLTKTFIEEIFNLAINTGDINICIFLIDSLKILPTIFNLNSAVENNNFGITELFLKYLVDPNNSTLETLLKNNKDLKILDLITKNREHFDLTDNNAEKIINLAMNNINDTYNIIRILIYNLKIVPNINNLNMAILYNNMDIIKLILDNGVIPDMSTLKIVKKIKNTRIIEIIGSYFKCTEIDLEILKNTFINLGITTINDAPIKSATNRDIFCKILENEHEVFTLGIIPEDITYENDCSSTDEELFTPISQINFKYIPKDKLIYYNKQCYYIYDLITYLESSGVNILSKESVGNTKDYLTRLEFNKMGNAKEYNDFYNFIFKYYNYINELKNISFSNAISLTKKEDETEDESEDESNF